MRVICSQVAEKKILAGSDGEGCGEGAGVCGAGDVDIACRIESHGEADVA
jgi:hypothetical protein